MFATLLVLLVFPTAMAFAAASDLITMRISNRVSLALLAGFAVAALAVGLPLATIGWHVAAAALVLAICFGFFSFGWMGGGDAKLASACALWLGWGLLLDYALLASVLGGALTLVIVLARTVPLPAVLLHHGWATRLHHAKTGIPYGIALAAAGLILYPHSVWMAAAAAF